MAYDTLIYIEQGAKRMVFEPGSELVLRGVVTGAKHGKNVYVDSVNGSAANDGLSWAGALLTTAAATALCTANAGDVVNYAPGHTERIANAQITLNVAGVAYIGHGEGSAAPVFGYDHANACIRLAANGIRVQGVNLLPSVTDVLIGIDVQAGFTDCKIIGVNSLPGEDGAGVDEFAKTVDVKAGCTRTLVDGCNFTQHASAAGVISCVCLTGASDLVTIRNSYMWTAGVGLTAPINGLTTLSTRLTVENCVLIADNEPGIEVLTGTTGVFRNVDIFSDLATIAAATVADGCAHFRVRYVEVGNESDAVVKTASVDD